jgi:hypothetical protein
MKEFPRGVSYYTLATCEIGFPEDLYSLFLEQRRSDAVSGNLCAGKGAVIDHTAAAGRASLLQKRILCAVHFRQPKCFLCAAAEGLGHIIAVAVDDSVPYAFRR